MKKAKKRRVDEMMCERGLCGTPDEAARLVMAGLVRTGSDSLVRKASELLPEGSPLFVEEQSPYVSRGALKLLPALERLLPDLRGMTALDIGSSTGGFTDLLLQKGADKVYAVDVGKGLLHPKLRVDARVVCLEGVNARALSSVEVPEPVGILAMDVSFISVTKIMPAADALLKPGAWAFILVKPQFEADRRDVAKGGVVTDEKVRLACVEKVASFASGSLGWAFIESSPSPIKGPKGNQECVAAFRKP